ncbi:hypothetical protein C8R45DRAFT_947736 [Mycena sanguinolenta]|nr:hypothetical protein C8R45DRAFT_947736 [Mycena sanguinolenta]
MSSVEQQPDGNLQASVYAGWNIKRKRCHPPHHSSRGKNNLVRRKELVSEWKTWANRMKTYKSSLRWTKSRYPSSTLAWPLDYGRSRDQRTKAFGKRNPVLRDSKPKGVPLQTRASHIRGSEPKFLEPEIYEKVLLTSREQSGRFVQRTGPMKEQKICEDRIREAVLEEMRIRENQTYAYIRINFLEGFKPGEEGCIYGPR